MSIFGKLLQATIKTVVLPVDMVKDCIPGGGGLVDGHQSHTSQAVGEIKDKLEDAYDELDD